MTVKCVHSVSYHWGSRQSRTVIRNGSTSGSRNEQKIPYFHFHVGQILLPCIRQWTCRT